MVKIIRVLSLIAVLSMVLFAFAGCDGGGKKGSSGSKANGSGGNSSEKIEYPNLDGRTIRYATWWDLAPVAGDSVAADKQIEKNKKLEDNFNCKFEYVNIPFEQYNETFISSTLAGDPAADIFTLHIRDFYPGLVSKGYLQNLGELKSWDLKNEKWNQAAIKFGTYKDNIYGIGTDNFGPQNGVFWNKTLFARDGLPNLYDLQDKKEWTWEKFREIAIKATRDTDGDDSIDQWGIDGGPSSFVASNNSYVVQVDDSGMPSFGLTHPNAIEALQFYSDLKIKDDVFFTAPSGSAWDYGLTRFAEGGTAMILGNYWFKYTLDDTMEDEYGFVYFPKGPKASEYTTTLSGFNLMGMSSAVKNPEHVAAVYNAFTERDEDFLHYEEYYTQSSVDAGTAKTIIDMIKNERYTLNMDESFPRVLTLCGDVYGQVSQGNMTAQAAVDSVKPAVEAALKDAMEELKK